MCLDIDLSSWRLVRELFLRKDVSHCKTLLLRILLGVDLCLVRLVLFSVFCSLSWSSGTFHIAHQTRCSFRFIRLRLLCVNAILTLVTSVSIDTCHLCLLHAAVRHLK